MIVLYNSTKSRKLLARALELKGSMASRELERLRNAILNQHYSLTEHAYVEMDDDNLDVLDVESAILTGSIDQILTKDPRCTHM